MSNVVVIGAGLAGLSAALHLIGQGHRVTVVEREDGPGGRGLRVQQDGFTFDLGPTVMTMPELLDEPLRAVGSSQEEAVPMRRLDPAYRGTFADGAELLVRGTVPETAEEIRALAGPHDARAFVKFERFLERLYEVELPHFIDANFDSPLSLLRNPKAMLDVVRMGGLGRLETMINGRFDDERVRRMVSFQALYAGLAPSEALGVYAVITYMDTMRGVFAPVGGMGAVPAGMASVVEQHATIAYATSVTGILRRFDGAVAGVETTAGPISADAVVCTMDPPVAYRTLLPELSLPWPLTHPTYSPSAVVWHVGAKGALPERAAHHNIHFGRQWKGCFDDLLAGRIMEDPSRLVSIPSMSDPELAAEGGHTLYVLEPVPNLDGDVDWEVRGPRFRMRLMDFLDKNGYPTDVVTERFVTPVEWAELGMAAGAPFALAQLFRQTGPFRTPNREKRVPGLVFAGSGTVPGVGVPMVLISGKLAARRVAEWVGTR